MLPGVGRLLERDPGLPSTMKPSKFSSKSTPIASDMVRTIRVSTAFISSKMAIERSWKTGSAFKMRRRVSTLFFASRE